MKTISLLPELLTVSNVFLIQLMNARQKKQNVFNRPSKNESPKSCMFSKGIYLL